MRTPRGKNRHLKIDEEERQMILSMYAMASLYLDSTKGLQPSDTNYTKKVACEIRGCDVLEEEKIAKFKQLMSKLGEELPR